MKDLSRALRTIETDLRKLASEDEVDPAAVRVQALRVGAQAEMVENGLHSPT